MSLRSFAVLAALAFPATIALPVSAQPNKSARPSAQPQPAASDVVRLKNGGVFRGTVAEYVPGKHVVIVLVTGTTRRFQLSEVAYAGPAASDPARPGAAAEPPLPGQGGARSPVTVNAPSVRLRLTASKPGVEYHRKVGVARAYASDLRRGVRADTYELMCSAPCDVTMPAGTHALALARDGAPLAAEPVYIPGDGALSADYTSYRAVRIVGTLVLIASLITGGYFIYDSITQCPADDDDCEAVDGGEMAMGVGIFIGGAIVGSLLSDVDDSAKITFTPTAPGGGGWEPSGAPVGGDTGSTSGAPLSSRPVAGWTPGVTLSYRF